LVLELAPYKQHHFFPPPPVLELSFYRIDHQKITVLTQHFSTWIVFLKNRNNDLVRCAHMSCCLSAAWIACCVSNQISEWENCLHFYHFGFLRDWDACIFLYKIFERLGKSYCFTLC
jgi:hypothetical protein